MDAVLSQILDACKLAKELEGSLLFCVDVASDAHYLLGSCEEIAGAFDRAIRGLYTMQSQSSRSAQMLLASAGEGAGNPQCAGMPAQRSLEIQPPATEFAGGSSYAKSAASAQRGGGRFFVQKSSKKRWKCWKLDVLKFGFAKLNYSNSFACLPTSNTIHKSHNIPPVEFAERKALWWSWCRPILTWRILLMTDIPGRSMVRKKYLIRGFQGIVDPSVFLFLFCNYFHFWITWSS